jgi:hypothetical protein
VYDEEMPFVTGFSKRISSTRARERIYDSDSIGKTKISCVTPAAALSHSLLILQPDHQMISRLVRALCTYLEFMDRVLVLLGAIYAIFTIQFDLFSSAWKILKKQQEYKYASNRKGLEHDFSTEASNQRCSSLIGQKG